MADSWAPEIAKWAASVTPDIPRIRAILDQLGIPNVDYKDPADYVSSAFAIALGQEKLGRFQAALAKAGLITDDAPAGIERELLRRLAKLQTFTSDVYRPVDARVAARRLLLASDLVCRIDVDDGHGTGILVASTLVATAAHVVAELVDEAGPGPAVVRGGSTKRIHVTFGHMMDLLEDGGAPTGLTGTDAPLAAKWLAFYSPPTRDEIAGEGFVLKSVNGIGAEGPWDLAILRLADAQQFRPMPPCESIPRRRFQIHVLHHPDDGTGNGLPMLWSVGTVDTRLGDPPVRLLHSANTSGGSSGAPVFDGDFRVVGLHQAGVSPAPGRAGAACNRAVPVLGWSSMLASLELPETAPLLRTVEKLDGQGCPVTRSVIGRLETRQRIWRSLFPDAAPSERLIAVTGEPGLGLRFTKHLVHAIVTRFGGSFAAIDVANCQRDDATTFADKVAGAFAASTRARPSAGLTTLQREVRSRTAPALSETLEAIANPGGAWLVLEGFDSTVERPSAAVVDLVRQLILELPQSPSVRLVLAGWQETLPTGFEASIEYLEAPSADDIARTFEPPDASPQVLGALLPFVEKAMREAAQEMPGACPYAVAERARAAVAATVGPLISALTAEGGGAP